MIDRLIKESDVTNTVNDAADKKRNLSSRGKRFDPDKRIDSGNKSPRLESLKRFNPDARINEIRTPKFFTKLEDRVRNTNLDNSEGGFRGTWTGKRGESLFIPSYDYMKKTLSKYGLEGINYIKGEADFSKISVATVEISNMTHERLGKGKNFDQANAKLAKEFNRIGMNGKKDWDSAKVEEYRKENKLTWHERCDCKTMDLVPTKIHDYFKHSGGVAEYKAKDGIGGKFDE